MLIEKKMNEWEKAQDELEPMPEPLVVPKIATNEVLAITDEKSSAEANKVLKNLETMEINDSKLASKSYNTIKTTLKEKGMSG